MEKNFSIPFTIEYQLNQKEYSAIAGRFIFGNFMLRRVPLLLALYLLYIALMAVVVQFDSTIWLLSILGIFILVGIVVVFSFYYPTYLYKRDPKLQALYHVEFSEDGITSNSSFGSSNLKWSYYKNAQQVGKGYILGAGSSRAQLIPRSAFGPGQEAAFRELIRRKLNFKP